MFDSTDDIQEIRTLTKEEAAVVKATNPALNPWRVVAWQMVVTLVVGLLGLLLTQKMSVAYSLVWGGLCVVVPAALFARGMMSKTTLMNAGTATAGFFLWEIVKIGLTLAMLFASNQVITRLGQNLNWPALIVGLIVVMKVYWLALLIKPRVSKCADNSMIKV